MRTPIFVTVLACLICACSTHCAYARKAMMDEYFVATDGNDAWSGKLAKPNRAKTDGPLATVERARDARERIVPAIDAELERIHKLGEALNKARALVLQGQPVDLGALGLKARRPLTPAQREARRNNAVAARAGKAKRAVGA